MLLESTVSVQKLQAREDTGTCLLEVAAATCMCKAWENQQGYCRSSRPLNLTPTIYVLLHEGYTLEKCFSF